MITTFSTKTTHKSEETFPKCDICRATATHAVQDCREVPTKDPEGYREFEILTAVRRGCADHTVFSCTTYLDGRKLRTDLCVPEKVPCL